MAIRTGTAGRQRQLRDRDGRKAASAIEMVTAGRWHRLRGHQGAIISDRDGNGLAPGMAASGRQRESVHTHRRNGESAAKSGFVKSWREELGEEEDAFNRQSTY